MSWLVDRLFPFRRLTVWLGVLVLIVSALSLALSALLVLPSLDQSLVEQRVASIARSADATAPTFASNFANALGGSGSRGDTDAVTAAYGDLTNTQASVYQVVSPRLLTPVTTPATKTVSPITMSVARGKGAQSGTTVIDGKRIAETAYLMRIGGTTYVVVLQSDLDGVEAAVQLTRRRSLLGAALALPLAVLAGAFGAALLTRRIRRLERASSRIAAGNLTTPIADHGRDELGALAVALDQMRDELARTDVARRAFVANASHELRTPVFALSGFLELLVDEEDEANRRRFLTTMQDQVERLTRLATDLLDLSRLDAGKVSVDREPVELAAVAEGIVRDLGPVAAKRGATLTLTTEPAMAIADETRVGQVARVLVDNALRHNPAGIEVRLSVGRIGAIAALSVEDSGPLIDEEQADRIFTRFARGSGAGEGSGLGLAIASELAERMGGRLVLDQSGERKAFRLELPADPSVE